MDNIFIKEDEVIANAENAIRKNIMGSTEGEALYKDLLYEYKKLLKQTKSLVKMSDMMQLQLHDLSRELERMSNTDGLTGIYNRRFFNEIFHKEWYSAFRGKISIGILMIDIDNFKKYNDTYGHLQGDRCLKLISEIIQKSVKRPRDMLARYGGEEFVVLLAETDIKGCRTVAEEIIKSIEAKDIKNAGSPYFPRVTVSVGIAVTIPDDQDSCEKLLNMADEALYRAKAAGRNCCME
ncbi:MAG TPA: GGDEF domain-containing protein [Petrotogaceae bacterium]|jgi:diguanylate cyclase (GGDEF)-like protein|nr:GGDEF domain-containing protein [Petrotogaceae bacterium]